MIMSMIILVSYTYTHNIRKYTYTNTIGKAKILQSYILLPLLRTFLSMALPVPFKITFFLEFSSACRTLKRVGRRVFLGFHVALGIYILDA